eukprot:9849918-Ditylum_brightwellii.AAC.1
MEIFILNVCYPVIKTVSCNMYEDQSDIPGEVHLYIKDQMSCNFASLNRGVLIFLHDFKNNSHIGHFLACDILPGGVAILCIYL